MIIGRTYLNIKTLWTVNFTHMYVLKKYQYETVTEVGRQTP